MIDNIVFPEKKIEKQYVEILVGLPASGKSTYALEKVKNSHGSIKRINKDNLRSMIDNNVFSKKNEKNIEESRDNLIKLFLSRGYSVIIDDTNLAPKHIENIEIITNDYARFYGMDIEIIINKDFLNVPLEECVQRDSLRTGKARVGRMVIFSMAKKFLPDIHKAYHDNKVLNKLIAKEVESGNIEEEEEENNLNNKIEKRIFKIPAIICDLDGTLALLNGRNPYDASECEHDILNEPVAKVLRMFSKNGTAIILLSGRENKFRKETLKFLEKHEIHFDELLMRTTKDFRKDNIIKLELYNNYIKDNFDIEFVLDDRNSVVDMWRKELQLPTFQVNYGDF
jgi:predicted kinase